MEALIGLLAILVVPLIVFDVATDRFGVDSREPVGDDHRR